MFVLLPLRREYTWSDIEINLVSLPEWYYVMFIIRSLRPLHIISIYGAARDVVSEIVKGWRNLAKAIVIMLGFMLMFASLGVQVNVIK